MKTRIESDSLGSLEIPVEKLYGIHTQRAIANFPLSGAAVHPELIQAYGAVKLACMQVNRSLGYFPDPQKADSLERACAEMAEGLLNGHVVVDALQGGAGTSTNMNVNEVLANRALEICGREKGDYQFISPLNDVNLHQSTNDTYPTALKVAAIRQLRQLEQEVLSLQEAFQQKEKEFASVVKVGRTQLQDAVLTTLGREMGAYAEAFNRDRWRIYKCEERLRVVNLGGTAIGTGLGAPRQFIFKVVEQLREITGIGLARAENLVDATQNADVFTEVSGILKASAVSLLKISNDLRLLASGPDAGLREIVLPPRQAGSSIMPGKVNPVIPEAVAQVAMKVIGNDGVITQACASGNLELNPFLPLVAHCLLESIQLLANACRMFKCNCIIGMQANQVVCRQQVENSTALVTALIPEIGYEKAAEVASLASRQQLSVRDAALQLQCISAARFDELITPEAICRLGN